MTGAFPAGTSSLLLLAAEVDPNSFSYQVGRAVPMFLMLIGIVKCAQIMRRPATNTKGVLALMLLLIGWLVAMAGAITTKAMGESRVTLAVVALLSLITAVAGIVLAIIAIIEVRGQPGRYNQGLKQAVCALLLSVCIVGLAGVGVYGGMQRQKTEIAALAVPVQPVSGGQIRFQEFNFTFDMPAKPWVRTDVTKLSSDACLALMRARPQMVFQLIAEDAAALDVSNEMLAEIAIGNMNSVAAESEVIEQNPHTVDGINGIRIYSRATLGQQRFAYVHWVSVAGYYLYQLITFGSLHDEAEVRAAAEDMHARFHLIDQTKLANSSGSHAISAHRSDRYGYSIDLTEDGWRKWRSLAKDAPDADFGARLGLDTCVAVYPVSLLGADPSLDATFEALLNRLGLTVADARKKRRLNPSGAEGYAANFNREIDGESYDYRVFLVKSRHFACLAAGWTSDPAKLKRIEDSIHSLRVDASDSPPFDRSKMSDAERSRHGHVFNDLGLHAYAADETAQAGTYFALSLEMDEEPVVAESVARAYSESGRANEALQILRPLMAKYSDRPTLRAWFAQLHADVDDEPEAIRQYAKLFTAGSAHEDEGSMRHYLNLLANDERYDEGIAAAEDYLRSFDSSRIVRDHAALYSLKGDPEKAAKLLLARIDAGEFDPDIARAAAGYQIDAGHYTEALTTLDRTLAVDGGATAETYGLRSDAEIGLGRYREAKDSLEIAADKAPDDDDIVSRLKRVSAMLGEGDNTIIKTVIDPVEIPAELIRSAPAAADETTVTFGEGEGANAYYVSRVTAISYVKDKEYRETEFRAIKVLSTAGVDAFTSMEFSFDPVFEQIYVNRLDVRDAEGKVVGSGRVSDYYVTDDNTRDVASYKKVLNVVVPGLKVGHTIELTLTKKDKRPPDAMPFTEHIFLASSPAMHNALFLHGPDVAALRHEAAEGVERKEIGGGIAWSVTSQPAYRYEPWQPPVRAFVPYVLVGESGAAWDVEARTYLSTLAELLKSDPDVDALAKRLTDGLSSDEGKVAALVRHVQEEYAYKAIAFGRRARIPQKVGDVIRNRYGDCKGHSLLLQQLLRSAGYPASLALVRSDGTLDATFPSLDQFNHMIVFAPSLAPGGSFIDCTDKHGLLAGSVPWGLGGGQALVLDEEAPRVVSVPAYSDESNTMHTARTITLRADGDVVVDETVTYDGYSASGLRDDLLSWDPKDRDDVIRQWIADPTLAMTIQTVSIGNLEDRTKPLAIELSYTIKGRFAAHGAGRRGSLPAVVERDYLSAPPVPRRTTPFRLEAPFVFRADVTVNPPDGFAVDDVPANQTVNDAISPYTITWKNEGKSLRASFALRSSAGTHPASAYAGFDQLRKQAIASLEPYLALVPAGR